MAWNSWKAPLSINWNFSIYNREIIRRETKVYSLSRTNHRANSIPTKIYIHIHIQRLTRLKIVGKIESKENFSPGFTRLRRGERGGKNNKRTKWRTRPSDCLFPVDLGNIFRYQAAEGRGKKKGKGEKKRLAILQPRNVAAEQITQRLFSS